MKYSKELLVAFQNQYKNKFGEDINLQVAEAELNKLARLVEIVASPAQQRTANAIERSKNNEKPKSIAGANYKLHQ